MDFTEIDLWWLLLHKRRRAHQTGRVFFYQMFVEPIKESPVMSLLRSLNVEVVPVQASNWADCYMIAVDEIEKRIRANPELLPIPSRENYAYEEYTPPTRAARPKTSQVSFKFMTAPRKPSAKKPS